MVDLPVGYPAVGVGGGFEDDLWVLQAGELDVDGGAGSTGRGVEDVAGYGVAGCHFVRWVWEGRERGTGWGKVSFGKKEEGGGWVW